MRCEKVRIGAGTSSHSCEKVRIGAAPFRGAPIGTSPAWQWQLFLTFLSGKQPPQLPNLPGRVHRQPWPSGADADAYADEWDRLEQRVDQTTTTTGAST
jgi:hypothetical protein